MPNLKMDDKRPSNFSDFAGIFLLAMGMLLYEVTLTRIFSFVIWSNYAFMIVSTALFGMGLAGVFMSLAGQRRFHLNRSHVPLLSLLFSVFIVASLLVIIKVPLVVGEFDKLVNWLYLLVIYVALILPFFFAGIAITILLSGEGKKVHRLYFYDLVGAAIGSILLVFVIAPLGASGSLMLAALMVAASAMVFSSDPKKLAVPAALVLAAVVVYAALLASPADVFVQKIIAKLVALIGVVGKVWLGVVFLALAAIVAFALRGDRPQMWRAVFALFCLAFLVATPLAEQLLPVKAHQAKRRFQSESTRTVYSKWSSLSRVDVTERKMFLTGKVEPADIWINGGENESFLARYSRTNPYAPEWRESLNFPYLFISKYPYKDVTGGGGAPKVAIIGSSGGTEVAYALSHGASDIDAVEMDPVICKLVSGPFGWVNDHMFDMSHVNLINDEGRSYIVNCNKTFDLIQMRNNFTPIAFASGSINLSETYLLTVEAILDYMNHLSDDGILAINRWGTARLCSLVRAAAAKTGITEVSKHVMIIHGEGWMVNGVYFRKKPYTAEDIAAAKKWCEQDKRFTVLYSPEMKKTDNLYAAILMSEDPAEFYRYAGFDLRPPTDNWPFFDHFFQVGPAPNVNDPFVPEDLKMIGKLLQWNPPGIIKTLLGGWTVPKSDVPLFAITLEIILISFFFVVLPMWLLGARGEAPVRKGPMVSYFSILGMAFIMIELCYIKQYILFLGNPAISISLVIAVLLVFSSVGSFLSERFGEKPVQALRVVFPAIFVVNAALIYIMPAVFDAFLGSNIMVRVLMTILMMAPIGTLMGMPFPLGLRLVHRGSSSMVGWAWGVNGFMTVVGSILTVFISLYLGFHAVLWTAGALYLLGVWVSGRLGQSA